jgi:broad specificity polyphosphatase/5'/3'-nucleotidase SurE
MSKDTCSFVNINAYSLEKFKGVKFTETCFRNYGDESYNIVQKDSKYSAVISLGQGKSSSRNYSDYQACEEGYISISKVFAEPICSPIDKNLDTNSFSL